MWLERLAMLFLEKRGYVVRGIHGGARGARYLANPTDCPECGGIVEGDSLVEVDSGVAYQKVHCSECHANWLDLYVLRGISDFTTSDEWAYGQGPRCQCGHRQGSHHDSGGPCKSADCPCLFFINEYTGETANPPRIISGPIC